MAYRGDEVISIGQLAKRTGVAVSALRFYQDSGLIMASRNAAAHRRFHRSDIRRVSFILIAQRLGFSLSAIRQQLEKLPNQRTPTLHDWEQLAQQFRVHINDKIQGLEQLRDTLDGCIGCGCLSLEKCRLYNQDDKAAALGQGPRYLLGDSSDQIT